MPKKYYAVARGRTVGLFTIWTEAQDSVSGYTGAICKAFGCLGLACEFLQLHGVAYILPNGQQTLCFK